MNSSFDARIFSNQADATDEAGCSCCCRHICPPGLELSSTTVTDELSSAARQAAAIPAGPAPTTSTSHLCVNSGIGLNDHPIPANSLTAATVRRAVDGHATLKTNPHPTEWTTRLPADGPAKRSEARRQYRRSDGASLRYEQSLSVYENLDCLRHEPLLRWSSLVDRARSGSLVAVSEFDRRASEPLPATW